LASRRRRRKSIGKVVTDVERRVRRVEKRPGATSLKRNVVTGEKIQYRAIPTKAIQADAITANEAEFGVTIVSDTEPTDYLKAGTTWFDPSSGAQSVYDSTSENFIQATAIDATARASADGKNTIYRQDYEPTGGTYVLGDTWFDTDDGNKIYRYSTAYTATVTNKQITSNVATLTVSSAHTFVVGETITVSGVDATFNGSYEVTATPTALTVRYAKTASNVTSTGSSGTITNTAGWKGFALGDGALINIAANKIQAGTLEAGVILASNIDAGQINAGTINASISMTAATIIGGTIQQGSSGNYILMDQTNTATIKFNVTGFTQQGYITVESSFGGDLGEMRIAAPAQGTELNEAMIGLYNNGSYGDISINTDDINIESQRTFQLGNPPDGIQLKYDVDTTTDLGAEAFVYSIRNTWQSLNSRPPGGGDGRIGDIWLTY
jgi:hypothetical protein